MYENRPFYFNVVVWGEQYVKDLVNYTIPSLLSPNNIPELVKRRRCHFVVVTTEVDQKLIQRAASFQLLETFLPVDFLYITRTSSPTVGSKWSCMTEGHRIFCEQRKEQEVFGIFLMPEMIMADGCLLYFDKIISTGARAIIMAVIRLNTEDMTYLCTEPVINISSRSLVEAVYRNHHSVTNTYIITDPQFQHSPGMIIWPLDGNTWLIRGLHIQPMLVDLTNAAPSSLEPALDVGNFIQESVGGQEFVHLVTDSDLAMISSLTPKDIDPTLGDSHPYTVSKESLCDILYNRNNNELHLWYFTQPVLYHTEDLPIDIDEQVKHNQKFAEDILNFRA